MVKLLTIFLTFTLLVVSCNFVTQKTKNKKDELIKIQEEFTNTNFDEHNAQNSLDWQGNYHGEIQRMDTKIKVSMTLNENNTYKIVENYDKKESVSLGKFQWIDNGNSIKLEDEKIFKVGEGKVIMLNSEDDEINLVLMKHP